MRIVMVNRFGYVTGGADTHCLALARALEARGHDIVFLATADSRNQVDRGQFVRLRVTHATRDSLSIVQRLDVAAAAIWNREASRAMQRLIEEFRPDVVHLHKLHPQLSAAPVRAASRAGVPVVQTIHDYEFVSASPRDHRGSRWDRDESRFSYRALNSATLPLRRLHAGAVDRWIAVSRFVADTYSRYGIESTVLRNFVDAARDPVTPFGRRGGAVLISRLSPEKGVVDVIEAARATPAVPVTVAGSGPLERQVREAAASLPNLTYAGGVGRSRVHELLGSARVALAPSRWQEPGGVAALEAMSRGTPVVAYAVGGLREYVGEPGAGEVIEPGPDRLAACYGGLHEDQSRWELCSANALTAVRERHDLGAYVERLIELYRLAADRARK